MPSQLQAQGHAQASADLTTSQGAWDERAQRHRVTAQLYSDLATVAPGDTLRLGVALRPDPEWHVYWKNSGESGLATQLTWRAVQDTALSFAPMTWPVPEVFILPEGPITTYGYATEVLHTTSLVVPKTFQGDALTIEVVADYLTCKVECIPGKQTLRLTLPVGARRPADANTLAIFERYTRRLPQPPITHNLRLEHTLSQDAARPGDTLTARLDLVTCPSPTPLGDCQAYEAAVELDITHLFLPDLSDAIAWSVTRAGAREDQRGVWAELKGRGVATRVQPDGEMSALAGVFRLRRVGLAQDEEPLRPVWVDLPVPLKPAGAAVTTQAISAPEGAAPDDQGTLQHTQQKLARAMDTAEMPAQESLGLLHVLWLAFLGGILLNVMPCVFPVLSIKIAGIAQIAQHERRVMVLHGVAYAGGILAAMMVLAASVLLMRALGAGVGWGFQFQSPLFLGLLAGALVLFATNLLGAFEFSVPMGERFDQLAGAHDGLKQSFAEGLLCVLLATPCSAPFMGTAVGFALAGSPLEVVWIFVMLALGLALPFVALCAVPGWTRVLPRPGPWLEHLRRALAMSLLATTIWLVWLLGQSLGVDGMAAALVFLLSVGLAGWVYGLVQYDSALRRRAIVMVMAALSAGVGSWALSMEPVAPGTGELETAPVSAEQAAEASARGELVWRAYDEDAIAREVEQGRVVFVDFTADWCITCKVNERNALRDRAMLERAAELGVVWFKADWTRRDERIRLKLAEYGKGGVPMYLIYTPHTPSRATLLPEVLTATLVREALERAARGN